MPAFDDTLVLFATVLPAANVVNDGGVALMRPCRETVDPAWVVLRDLLGCSRRSSSGAEFFGV